MTECQVLDKSKVAPDERRLLQSVLGLPVDESSSEEEEDDSSGESDGSEGGGAGKSDVGEDSGRDEAKSGGVNATRPRLPREEVDALPTDPTEVIRLREVQKKRAGVCSPVATHFSVQGARALLCLVHVLSRAASPCRYAAELHSRLEEQRRKLAEASLSRLDRLAQERLETTRSELEAVRGDIVARSKQRQAEVRVPIRAAARA